MANFIMLSTFVLIKPDALSKGYGLKILLRLEDAGFQIKRYHVLEAKRSRVEEHYEEHKNKDFFESLCEFLCSGPLAVVHVKGGDTEIVSTVRRMLGKVGERGTLRGDFGTTWMQNGIHAADSSEAALREIKLWFTRDQIVLNTNSA